MALMGESWVKSVGESQGFVVEHLCREDVLLCKDKIAVLVEEKDWKYPVVIKNNKIFKLAINKKPYRFNKGQVMNYYFEIKSDDMKKKVYRFVIPCYVFSVLQGRQVQPLYFRKFGGVFCVSKTYFPIWLKSIERTYLGEPSVESQAKYIGGK